jgi:two-component system, response regulator RegA
LSSLKTFTSARDHGPDAAVNVLEQLLRLAGFQVSTTGRFWASTEGDDGLSLISPLRTHHPAAVIVVASGYLSVAHAVRALRAGADTVVAKPFSWQELLAHAHDAVGAAYGAAHDELCDTPTLARAEWEHICRVLDDCGGNVSMAARRLGIYRQSLQRKLRRYAPRR